MPHCENGNLDTSNIPKHLLQDVPDAALVYDPGYEFKKISHGLFHHSLFEHEPKIEDVRQIGIGDCFFLAALHSILSMDPLRVEDMMRDERGGWEW